MRLIKQEWKKRLTQIWIHRRMAYHTRPFLASNAILKTSINDLSIKIFIKLLINNSVTFFLQYYHNIVCSSFRYAHQLPFYHHKPLKALPSVKNFALELSDMYSMLFLLNLILELHFLYSWRLVLLSLRLL